MAMKFGEGLRTESKQTPVLIVGAGPVGLSMACFLRRYGMVCRIVDQKPSPTPEPESRALGLQARTLEVFEALGLVDSLLEDGRSVFGAVAYQGRRPRFRLDFATIADETAYPFLLSIPQGRTERRLLERLEALGGQVDWQTQLTGLRHQDAEVSVTLTDPDGQSREERVSWLIGCDGAHSVVRHALGLNFPGTVYSELFLLADLQISPGFSEDYAHVMLMPDGTLPMIPLPEPGRWRLIETTGDLQTDEEDAVIRRFNALLRTHAPKPVTVSDPNWISNFHIHRRVVDRLQVGRCFVLGDAAHIHSPVGGQGLNTGVQDAANLAWKLALVVHGQAASPLLETTDIERLPVAKALLANTDRATRLALIRNPLARAARNLVASTLLRFRFVQRRIVRAVAELTVSYPESPLSAEDWLPGPADPALSPRPGQRLPNPSISRNGESIRLHEILAQGLRWTVLLFSGTARLVISHEEPCRAVLEWASEAPWSERLQIVLIEGPGSLAEDVARRASVRHPDPEGRLHRRFGCSGSALYLVRPDGSISYRSRPPSKARLLAYFQTVLGDSSELMLMSDHADRAAPRAKTSL